MWTKWKTVKNGYTAQTLQEFFRAEGVNIRIVPPLEGNVTMMTPRDLWVPDSKTHVADELLRKI